MSETQRELLDAQLLQLRGEREPWMVDWKDLAENFLSWRSRALFTQGAKAGKRNKKLIDTAPVLALRTLQLPQFKDSVSVEYTLD